MSQVNKFLSRLELMMSGIRLINKSEVFSDIIKIPNNKKVYFFVYDQPYWYDEKLRKLFTITGELTTDSFDKLLELLDGIKIMEQFPRRNSSDSSILLKVFTYLNRSDELRYGIEYSIDSFTFKSINLNFKDLKSQVEYLWNNKPIVTKLSHKFGNSSFMSNVNRMSYQASQTLNKFFELNET